VSFDDDRWFVVVIHPTHILSLVSSCRSVRRGSWSLANAASE
jgi:hypothetical protein